MRLRAPTALAACLLALAACGGESGDLIAFEVSGGLAAGRGPLEIVVASDGRASCNDRESETIPSELLIDARDIERDLGDLAERGASYPAPGADRARYVARIKAGTVRWTEGARGLPDVLPRAQLLALRLDRLLCR